MLLVAAALLGTADRSAAEPPARSRKGRPPRRFQLVRQLLRLREVAGRPLRRPLRARRAGRIADRGAPADAAREAAPKQGVDFSGTNVQEEGVDEPDIVKTNGNTLFAVANGKLNAVDVSGAKPRLLDTLKLDPG